MLAAAGIAGNGNLLIEPFGIEIEERGGCIRHEVKLLIEPFGIEIRVYFDWYSASAYLLIEPFGIEIDSEG